jgi:hypothetical protein
VRTEEAGRVARFFIFVVEVSSVRPVSIDISMARAPEAKTPTPLKHASESRTASGKEGVS